MNINEIKKILSSEDVDKEILIKLQSDSRKGVKNLLEKYYKRKENEKNLFEEYKKKRVFEDKCYSLGYNYICGIDEVGRGPLAGPVVAAGVILKKDSYYEGLTDSKKLSKSKREELYKQIKDTALDYFIVELDNLKIEEHNIYNATKLAMEEVVNNLSLKPDFILVDAMPLEIKNIPSHSIIKGDEKSVSIAAASVLAKIYRDNLMKKYAEKYPYYDFENNMGYGTKKHLEGIEKFGICDIHRKNFEPIKSILRKRGKDDKEK